MSIVENHGNDSSKGCVKRLLRKHDKERLALLLCKSQQELMEMQKNLPHIILGAKREAIREFLESESQCTIKTKRKMVRIELIENFLKNL